ncbi:MAG: DUF2141 domain-containing protein, partial [Cyclobacteriaceae bacterium]
KMKKIFTLLALIVTSSLSAQENSYDLVIKVENVGSQNGKIRIALYDSEDKFLDEQIMGGSVDASVGLVLHKFTNLRPGTYAVSLFHDQDGGGKLNSNFMGIPSEPYAFSNNAKGMFGPPDFEDCKFEMTSTREITIQF